MALQIPEMTVNYNENNTEIYVDSFELMQLVASAISSSYTARLKFSIFLRMQDDHDKKTPAKMLFEDELDKIYNLRTSVCKSFLSTVQQWFIDLNRAVPDQNYVLQVLRAAVDTIWQAHQDKILVTVVKDKKSGNIIPTTPVDNEDTAILEELELLDYQLVENNYFDSKVSLESIVKLIRDEGGRPDQKNLHIVYDQELGLFRFGSDIGIPVRSYPPREFATLSKNAIIQLCQDEDTNAFLDLLEFNMPTLRNRTALKQPEFRRNLWRLVRKTIREFIYFPKDRYYDLATAMIFLSYFYDAFPTTPYVFVGGDKGSGKSQFGEIFEVLSYRPISTIASSGPYLFRTIDGTLGTLIIDEAQGILVDIRKSDIRDILKAGYQKGRCVGRVDGERTRTAVEYLVYCPKVIISTDIPDPILIDRCIPFWMYKPTTVRHYYKPKEKIPLNNMVRDYLMALRMMHIHEVSQIELDNEYPDKFRNRNRDHALPILKITAFFYPEVLDVMAKVINESLSLRQDLQQGDFETRLLDYFVTTKVDGDPIRGRISVGTIVEGYNQEIFGPNWKRQNVKNAFDNRGLGVMLSKLGFKSTRARSTQYVITDEFITRGYAMREMDASDIFGRAFCAKYIPDAQLDEYRLTGLGNKHEKSPMPTAKDGVYYTPGEKETIEIEVAIDEEYQESLWAEVKEVTDAEEAYAEDQARQYNEYVEQLKEEGIYQDHINVEPEKDTNEVELTDEQMLAIFQMGPKRNRM